LIDGKVKKQFSFVEQPATGSGTGGYGRGGSGGENCARIPADRRIEAAICRQFGAGALLILPIYDHRASVGVLEVTFRNAHEFHDREVRAYRLMASLVGDAVNRAAALPQVQVAHSRVKTIGGGALFWFHTTSTPSTTWKHSSPLHLRG